MSYPVPVRLMLLLTFLAWGLCGHAPCAHAQQIYRCVGADGGLILSDRKCENIGAQDSPTSAANADGFRPLPYRGGCARTLQSLADTLRQSIGSNDPNRLATIYLWRGQSTTGGYDIMDRLTEIARHPLVALTAVYPSNPAPDPYGYVSADTTSTPSTLGTSTSDPATEVPDPVPAPVRTPAPRAPVALRLEQTLSDGTTPTRAVLGLRRALGCWWVVL